MMKKLLFCLLTLVGTGMFYSCQQDEFVNESTVSKGATITATLPTDAQSRLALGEPENGTVKLKWDENDKIQVNINNTNYIFEVASISVDGTTATLYCENAPAYLPADTGGYDFVCNYNEYGYDYNEQSGTLDFLTMTTTFSSSVDTAWEAVSLKFSYISSLIVEIELPEDVTANKVSFYDSSNGALIASTATGSYSEKVYLSLSESAIGSGLVLVETSNGDYVAQVPGKNLEPNKVYSIKQGKMDKLQNTGTTGTPETTELVKYGSVGNTYIIYGEGAIGFQAFWQIADIHQAIMLEGVSGIGSSAFDGCTNLASVTIAKGVTIIEQCAFNHCQALTSITIPESIEIIEDLAFQACTQLTSITVLNSSPCECKRYAFDDCNDNLTIYVPSEEVETYKGTSGWSFYAGKIQAIL